MFFFFLKILFFVKDHHVPLNEQQQEQNVESVDEQEPSNERPLTPINRNGFDTNAWVNLSQN